MIQTDKQINELGKRQDATELKLGTVEGNVASSLAENSYGVSFKKTVIN